jgi:CHAT domain-containing protein
VPSARILLGKEATEPALLGLSAPGILHIATHGLFADDPTSLNRSRSAHSHFEEDATPPPNHPLLRSALALAGAASYQPAVDEQEANRPDGLVTALELAGMNLWGTQLVVLSACNTGRGSVQLGQGVYGLRRALITAGAETLVVSLWKVDDEATQELMTGYYHRLRQGEGRAEAMQKAAREMRQKRSHPYYWASFVVIGRGDPLRGTW